jgi:uncharacterized protein YajQ (UPF0234 family)
MPSFDIVSEVDKQEIDNALNQARKELATRFDFKGSVAEINYEKDKITLTAEDANLNAGLICVTSIRWNRISRRWATRGRN